jgi:hypothetical protein
MIYHSRLMFVISHTERKYVLCGHKHEKHVHKSAFKLYWLNTIWAQMIFTISEIYFEAIRQDTTARRLDIELQMPKFILPLLGIRDVHYW